MEPNLRIPGPTPLPIEVREALSKPMINHRGPEFAVILREVTTSLKSLFRTKNDIFIYPSAGTGAMEASVVNFLSPGDKVLVTSIGYFGERFIEICRTFGADVQPLIYEWGEAAKPEEIAAKLQADPDIKAVVVTHNETSTGVTNPLGAIAAAVRPYERLLMVDAISSIGAIELPVDNWGCDVVATGAQKSWMTPPGLSMLSVSKRAWAAHRQAKMPRHYWDITAAKSYYERGQTPYTPAVSLFYGLQAALQLMEAEGLDNIIARHARMANRMRQIGKDLGMKLFADERVASDTVTALMPPGGLDANKIVNKLRDDYNVVVAGGQHHLSGKIFRVGHVGYCFDDDIEIVGRALAATLKDLQ